jgi:hypothetical protein
VRRGPKGADDGGATQLTEGGGDNGAAAAVRSAGVDTRPRKESGATECSGVRSRGRMRWERKKGVWRRRGALYR